MTQQTSFDPTRYLTKIGNSLYLEVKWRLVWFREQHPDAEIETELMSHQDQFAIFRAKISIPEGGSATGWGSEQIDNFRDYIEKAETKAVGRALAALGFGTQFCTDFEFGADRGKIVDAPVDIVVNEAPQAMAPREQITQQITNVNQNATSRQMKFIQAIARELGLSDEALHKEIEQNFGKDISDLSRRDASALIERLQVRRGQVALAS